MDKWEVWYHEAVNHFIAQYCIYHNDLGTIVYDIKVGDTEEQQVVVICCLEHFLMLPKF